VRYDELTADFDRLFAELTRLAAPGRFEPNADMYVDAEGKCIIVHVELAGADAEHLRVGIDQQNLFIFGKRIDRTDAIGSIYQKEILYGPFVKKMHLLRSVDDSAASAVYRDGILTISLPIAAQEFEPTRRTEIRMTVRRTLV
jgi:HSP20 family protein